jgi:S-adenosylmethionine uptake transporter
MQSLWMLVATFVFAIMGVCVKLASSLYSTAEIVMYRGVIGVAFMLLLIRLQHGTYKTAFPLQHLWRGVVGVAAIWIWFYAIGILPLSMAMTLNYMSPIWMATILFIAGWRRHQRASRGILVAIGASFIGVVILLQPSMRADQWLGGLGGLISGILSATAYLQVRQLGLLGEPEYRVVFYFSATGLLGGLAGTLLTPALHDGAVLWHAHSIRGIALLLAMGLSAVLAQIAMTRAYRLGNTLVTANLQYSGIIFSSFWGVVLWNDTLGWPGWLGIALILCSGIAATFYNVRNNPVLPTPVAASGSDPIATEI